MSIIKIDFREQKPRTDGLTMVLDKGLGTHAIEDMLETAAPYIDYVKLGWGTSFIYPNIQTKIDLYRKHNIPLCLGGTAFEIAYLNNKVDEFVDMLKDLGLEMLEISDGTVDMLEIDKLKAIEKLSKDFKVLSEFGSKNPEKLTSPKHWVKGMNQELKAGAYTIIAEGRESGTAGIYRANKEIRTGLVEDILSEVPREKILWEAPEKMHQSWFVKLLGPNVSLGNIIPYDALALETLRLGLRSDTLLHIHNEFYK